MTVRPGGRLRGVRRLLAGAPTAFVIRLGGRGVTFLVAIWLARLLGAEGYGVYAFATSVVAVLFAISSLGFGGVLLRQTALYKSIGRPDLIVELIARARRTVLALAVASSLVTALAALLFLDPIFVATVLLILPAVPVLGANLIWQGILQGLGFIEDSFLSTYVIYPIGMVLGIGLLLLATGGVDPEQAAVVYVISFSVGILALWAIARKRIAPALREERSAEHHPDIEAPVLAPFTAITFAGTIEGSLGLVLLGLFGLPDSVADLQVAVKLVEPIAMVALVVNLSLAPRMAVAFANERLSTMQPAITRNVIVSAAAALPIAILLILGKDFLLGLFGSEFDEAALPLTIMVAATLFNVATGISASALTMAREWSPALVAKGLGLGLNLALCLILIPILGATGAALAFAAGILTSNTVMAIRAWNLLGLDTTVLAPLTVGRERRGVDR